MVMQSYGWENENAFFMENEGLYLIWCSTIFSKKFNRNGMGGLSSNHFNKWINLFWNKGTPDKCLISINGNSATLKALGSSTFNYKWRKESYYLKKVEPHRER